MSRKSAQADVNVEPLKKKPKTSAIQPNLLTFFPSVPSTKSSKNNIKTNCSPHNLDASVANNAAVVPNTENSNDKHYLDKVDTRNSTKRTPKSDGSSSKTEEVGNEIPDPIVPTLVPTPRNVMWQSLHDNLVIVRKVAKEDPRTKVAALDLDGTLVVWSASVSGFWPSQMSHYELWSKNLPDKLRSLHDDGFKLIVFSNQGGIQKAHQGKKAVLVKGVIDWLAHLIDRPLHAVLSTKSMKKSAQDSFHKPTPKMWEVAINFLNKGTTFDVSKSFFVGDSADPDDEQGGVDMKFAQAVGTKHGSELRFYTPSEYFGPGDSQRRERKKAFIKSEECPPPKQALVTRSALLGGYLKGPILLILCGVQGSGKSTFCKLLVTEENGRWVQLSQDTINNGKPGKREKVEEQARAALGLGKCVVVDRMHLDPEQRRYFVQVAKHAGVAAHILFLNPAKEVIMKRVRERTNHPGKVQGEDGARRAMQAMNKIVMPTYSEDVQLITCASTTTGVTRLAQLYKPVAEDTVFPCTVKEVAVSDNLSIPFVALGTMCIGKKIAKDVVVSAVSSGIRAVDTAPTYHNEDQVGAALSEIARQEIDLEIVCIAKIPKTANTPESVRLSFNKTLQKLKKPFVHLLLLHWPCDVIRAGTLLPVWKEMELLVNEGKCKALGVCNFNEKALSELLSNCSIPPVVNQVERHPLLSQMGLVDFCARNNITIQAHTPLGQGKDELLQHSVVKTISQETSMSPAQVVLSWNIQQGILVTPRCQNAAHAKALVACQSLKLAPNHMKLLDGIDRGKRFVAPPFMYGKASYCWGVKYSK